MKEMYYNYESSYIKPWSIKGNTGLFGFWGDGGTIQYYEDENNKLSLKEKE